MSWWSRLVNLGRPEPMDDDLAEEQRFHIEARADDLEARGLSREGALAQASRQFGNRLRLRESSREVKLFGRLESVWRDFRFGLRLLRKDAAVSTAAVASLALAIGACTAAFTLIEALVLRQLPLPEPQQLVYLKRASSEGDGRYAGLFSYPFYERARQALASQADVFSVSHQSLRQAVLPDAKGIEEKLRTQFVSGNAFRTLGVMPAVGRLLDDADDVAPGAHQVAVISHGFWTRRLGANPAVVGQWLHLEQRPYEIVGVTQRGFTGVQPGMLTDVWVPNQMFQRQSLTNAEWNWLYVWGRLRPDAGRDAIGPIASTAFATLARERADRNKVPPPAASQFAIQAMGAATGFSGLRQEFARPLFALAVIVVAVLLIACSNVANLLLARGAARSREMSLRASIGAGRGRLVQQILIESSVLTLAATMLGIICAYAAVPVLVQMLATNENPVYLDVRLNVLVLVFVAALGGLTTLLFGLLPAFRASRSAPAENLALAGRRLTADPGTSRSLVAAQVAFSVMILFVAALLLRSFDKLLAVDLGFTPERVTLVSIEARDPFDRTTGREISRQLLERVRMLPGVESAAMSGWAFFRGWSNWNGFTVQGGASASARRITVSSGFFHTMRTPMIDGRELVPRDGDADDPVPVVVNETFARSYLAGGRAVGRRMTLPRDGQPVAYEVVGVVANARDGSVRGDIGPYVFSPLESVDGTLEVRSTLDSRIIADRLRLELAQVHASLRLVDVTEQSALVGNTLLRERLLAVLSGFFATLGILLAAIGLYGVLSYGVVRRTREIGIRIALGAPTAAVVRPILGRVVGAVAAGAVVGLAAGVYFARFVRMLLFEIEPLSPSSLGLPVLGLLAVAAIASWFPARRATRVDPADALRTD
jgi:predicted permease